FFLETIVTRKYTNILYRSKIFVIIKSKYYSNNKVLKYSSCNAKCKNGYFSVTSNEHKLSEMTIECSNEGKWDIPPTNQKEIDYIQCDLGCNYYGSQRGEDSYGMVVHCDDLGKILGLN
ncbi:hypothetical protein MHBO_003598, partial [Bonamia ostreae]